MLDGKFNKKFHGNFNGMYSGVFNGMTNRMESFTTTSTGRFKETFDGKFKCNFNGKLKWESAGKMWLAGFIISTNICSPRLPISPRLDDRNYTVNTTRQIIMVSLDGCSGECSAGSFKGTSKDLQLAKGQVQFNITYPLAFSLSYSGKVNNQ